MAGVTLTLHAVTKIYPSVMALNNLTVEFHGGEVHAVIGKNGSGKSTMVKVISGAVHPTKGEIRIDGRPVTVASPIDAFREGIATVYQELSLIPSLTVAENILLGRLPQKGRMRIDWVETRRQAQNILDSLDAQISVQRKVSELDVWQQQVVEIAKAMSFAPAVIILDEPTSSLAKHETEKLFTVIKQLKTKGVVIIYITHRLQELYQIADVVTVLRDGEKIGTARIDDTPPKTIVQMMFGKTEMTTRPENLMVSQEPVLTVSNLTREPYFKDISFTRRNPGDCRNVGCWQNRVS
jgi:ribose transport system ATP-binding protein